LWISVVFLCPGAAADRLPAAEALAAALVPVLELPVVEAVVVSRSQGAEALAPEAVPQVVAVAAAGRPAVA